MRTSAFGALAALVFVTSAGAARAGAPYPDSTVVTGIDWDKSSYRSAGRGGDIWATTSAADGAVYTAWGDGQVGCPGKVSYGVAAVTGGPGANLRVTRCGPKGSGKGKIGSLVAVGTTLYAAVNLQDRAWPGNSVGVWRSGDKGKTWQKPAWAFAGADLRPDSFVNYGPGNTGAKDGYVYLTAIRPAGNPKAFYLV